jgi:DNA-binding PadR family transcriptional regulator
MEMEKMDESKVKLLSSDLLVAGEIYKVAEHEKKSIYFTKLVERLKKGPKPISRGTISRSLERLHDLHIIKTDWVKIDKQWVRSITISGESKDFVKEIYENFLK